MSNNLIVTNHTMDFITHYASPLGTITLASDGEALVGLWFEGQKHFGATLMPNHCMCDTLPIFTQTKLWLDLYFSGQMPHFTPTLRLRTSPFQQRICALMLSIPYGQTTTYGAIAQTIAHERGLPTMSAQAIGHAVGHNSIAILIPCHRVVGSGGKLTGYAGGIDKKAWLLCLEDYHSSVK